MFCLLDCFDLIKSRYYLTFFIVTAGGGYWSIEIRKWHPANYQKHLMWLLVQLVYVKSKISVHFLVYVSCTWRFNYHYWKLNHWIMQFYSPDWLRHTVIWAIIPCSPNIVTVRASAQNQKQAENRLLLQIKSEIILDILWAFLIKQLCHSHLLDMRWL